MLVRIHNMRVRLKQFLHILTSTRFSNESAILSNTECRYSLPEEVNHYEALNEKGLLEFEERAVKTALKETPTPQLTLVLGCGAGREAFALEDKSPNIIGVDTSVPMLDKASEISQYREQKGLSQRGQFLWCTPEELSSIQADKKQKFDLIYCNAFLSSNIPGQNQRKAFFDWVISQLSENGSLLVFPDFCDISTSLRYRVASWVLRYRFFNSKDLKWQKGDTIRNYLGDHFTGYHPIYYHYYSDLDDFLSNFDLNRVSFEQITPEALLLRLKK